MAQIEQFVQGLNESVDAASFNRRFAADILWGNPNGGILAGFDDIHAIHSHILAGPMRGKRSRFTLEAASFVERDVAVAHVRREAIDDAGRVVDADSVSDQYVFHEMAMYVLVWRDGEPWLAAGQNTPIRMAARPPASP